MKLDQLRYVCAIYEAGSIRQAADKLFLSQPNLSNSISQLERELGFNILLRSHNGVRFTDKGLELVQYATRILEECETIRTLCDKPTLHHFRVIAPHYPPVDQAFVQLCHELDQTNGLKGLDLRLTEANWVDSLPTLSRKSAELAVVCVPEETACSVAFRRSLDQNGLEFYPLANTTVVIKLSKNHPLLAHTPFPFERLGDYPMTEYSARTDTLSAYGGIKLPFSFHPSRVYVDTGRTRSQLIAQSNIWGVATKLPKAHQEEYGIQYVELPDSSWSIGYLRDPERPSDPIEDRFLTLLRQELQFLEEPSV